MPQSLTPASKAPRAINQQLILARQRRQWSKKQAARLLGISAVVYSAWETGRHEPTLPHLRALCQLFSSPPDRLGFPVYHPEQQMPEISADLPTSHDETQATH